MFVQKKKFNRRIDGSGERREKMSKTFKIERKVTLIVRKQVGEGDKWVREYDKIVKSYNSEPCSSHPETEIFSVFIY